MRSLVDTVVKYVVGAGLEAHSAHGTMESGTSLTFYIHSSSPVSSQYVVVDTVRKAVDMALAEFIDGALLDSSISVTHNRKCKAGEICVCVTIKPIVPSSQINLYGQGSLRGL